MGLVIISDDGDDTSSYTNGSGSPEPQDDVADIGHDEKEEKARLISQVLELQNTLDGKDLLSFSFHLIFGSLWTEFRFADLSQRVDGVKEENLKLRSENQVLGQYIENLMSASSVFQSTTSPHVGKKK